MIESSGRRELPDDLELMPPGAALGSLLASVDRAALSDEDRVRLLRARHRLASHVQGELFADLYAVSLDDDDPDESAMVCHGAPSRYRWATSEVAFALRWTETAAGARLEQARQLAEDLPRVFAALRAGHVDMPKVLVICELASWLDDVRVARRLVDEVIERAPEWTTGQLRAKLRQLVLAVDPTAARRRCVTALKTRRVESFPNEDGTGEVWGRSLPPQDAAAAWERLTAIARAARSAGDDRTMDQLRADALLDLLIGEGIAVGQPVGRHLAGLAEADGPPGHMPLDSPTPATAADTAADTVADTVADTAANTAANTVADSMADRVADAAAGAQWDPAWPTGPDDRLSADQLSPHPAGPPVDVFDDAGQAYDGVDWPSDWPGRWVDDPAVTAAGNGRDALGQPAPARAAPARAAPGALPGPRRGTIELLLPLSTALGRDNLPGELAGWGPVIADIARHIANEQRDAQWRYSAYNRLGELEHHGILTARPIPVPDSAAAGLPAVPPARAQAPLGAPAPARRAGRRPTAALAAHVRARNRTCVAPGCRIPARTCDLDHTTAWADGGATTEDNLGPSCRRHHRLKHESGATLWQLEPGGAFVWTTRRGMQYLTKPDPPLLNPRRLTGPPGSPDFS
jgi:hypothetical protein